MADPKSPLDELNSSLDEMNIPETAPDATLQGNSEVDPKNTEDIREAVEIGGRLWTSAEDLDRSYRHLQSMNDKVQKSLADWEKKGEEFKKYEAPEYKNALEMAQYFQEHPEIHEKVRDFFQKIKSGDESPNQAIKSSGLSKESPELKELLKWKAQVEQERQAEVSTIADKAIDEEIDDLRKTYKLDDQKLDQVLVTAQKFNKNLESTDDWIPLKDIYLMLSSKHAWRKAARGGSEVLPTPRSETIDPTSPPRQRTPEDVLMSSLSKMGI